MSQDLKTKPALQRAAGRVRAAATVIAAAALCSGLGMGTAEAKPRGLRALRTADPISVDGVPGEWSGGWRDCNLQSGRSRKPTNAADISGRAMLAYDDDYLYLAADVRDDKLVSGGDHVELLLGIPGGRTYSALLYPGQGGKRRASARRKGGGTIRGAVVVEAPSDGGYTLEAKIPWSAIPLSSTVRVGYRGAILIHDADVGRRVDYSLSTAGSRQYASLPPLSTEPELALGAGLLRENNITRPPTHNLIANVTGDKRKERVLVYDQFLVVLGPGYGDGSKYYFRDLGIAAGGKLKRFEVRDYTGDGRADFLLRRQLKGSRGRVDVLEILSYHDGNNTPSPVFSHEVALKLEGGGQIDNDVSVRGAGRGTRITLRPGKARNVDQEFTPQPNAGTTPLLVPWGSIASQVYGWRDGGFELIRERKQSPKSSPPPPPPPLESSKGPARPTSSTATKVAYTKASSADVAGVYAHYKKERRVSGAPRFDVRANFAEDSSKERLVVHGRDLVLFGRAFRNGRGFAAVSLTNFERAADIKSVTSQDVTGDGKHEILVRGTLRRAIDADLGGGEMDRSVILIFQIQSGRFKRVFAAEIGRQIGSKSIRAELKLGRGSIELRPGRARGYDESTYPWLQKKEPADGFEPLLLPWGGVKRVKLRYRGGRFER